MKTMEKFANWFVEHDKRIMDAHLKREKNTFKKELQRIEEERDRIRSHLYRLDALIEKQEELGSCLPQTEFSRKRRQKLGK